jgi:hypothetical protein
LWFLCDEIRLFILSLQRNLLLYIIKRFLHFQILRVPLFDDSFSYSKEEQHLCYKHIVWTCCARAQALTSGFRVVQEFFDTNSYHQVMLYLGLFGMSLFFVGLSFPFVLLIRIQKHKMVDGWF